ncbi:MULTISPECIES: hypothetical protein [Rhizobium]|uniref:Uncharacterized protein n=1 Tax=Rhizobium esperanzae TaxID=1967781 RepID=A0A7W6UTP0_9HYPH|nr:MULTISPECIES: hypothetical protein [Rhizobium]MBB4444175.1 hypothetical protein [Rhizobium esperanzae]
MLRAAQLDAACGAWHAGYKIRLLEGQHHLVNRRSCNAEVATHVGFGGRLFEDAAVGVDEGQVLALDLRKAASCRCGLWVK